MAGNVTCERCGQVFWSRKTAGRRFCSRACSNIIANSRAATRLAEKPQVAVWSCGGGVDSTAIACLIAIGRLPKPDYAVMADVGYERDSTWRHVETVLKPRMAAVGVELRIIRTTDYRDNNLIDASGFVVIPAYRRGEDGKISRLNTHCSANWKAQVIRKWLRQQGVERCQTWLGIAAEEAKRVRENHVRWAENRYPLIELGMTREDCIYLLAEHGWPKPPRTSCWFCPGQSNREWSEAAKREPHEFARACETERQLQIVDPNVYLHATCLPLAEWVAQKGGITVALEGEVLRASIKERHVSGLHLPMDQIEAGLIVCERCDRMKAGRCARFNGCSSFDRYVTEVLYGKCPAWVGQAVIEHEVEWACER